MELALYYAGLEFSYCLGGTQVQSDAIPLLKLHGSINWERPTLERTHRLEIVQSHGCIIPNIIKPV